MAIKLRTITVLECNKRIKEKDKEIAELKAKIKELTNSRNEWRDETTKRQWGGRKGGVY